MDAGEQTADAVADPGGLPGQVVVEPDQHVQLGQHVVTDVDLAQSVRQRAGGISDNERVAGVGLGGAGVQIRDPAHRQPGQVAHVMPARAGHRDWQRTDRGRLIDHDQHRPVCRELVEHRPQLGLAVGQRRVVHPLPGRVQTDSVVFALAHIQAEEDLVTAAHPPCLSFVAGGRRSSIDGRHPHYGTAWGYAEVLGQQCGCVGDHVALCRCEQAVTAILPRSWTGTTSVGHPGYTHVTFVPRLSIP